MRSPSGIALALAGLLAVTSCGAEPIDLEGSPAISAPAPPVSSPTSRSGPYPSRPGGDTAGIDAYVADMESLAADYQPSISVAFQSYVGDAVPPETDAEWIDHYAGLWEAITVAALDHAASVELLKPPASLAEAHGQYALSIRLLWEAFRTHVEGFTTLEQHEAFLDQWFQSGSMPPPLFELEVAVYVACNETETVMEATSHTVSMSCPDEPLEWIEVQVDAGDVWTANPTALPKTASAVFITITNTGDEPIRPVLLDIFEGEPANLPVFNGLVDLSLSGQIDPSSGYSSFGVAYAGGVEIVEGGFVGEPAELAPGESVTVNSYSPGPIVAFDYRRGEFEMGSYVVIGLG